MMNSEIKNRLLKNRVEVSDDMISSENHKIIQVQDYEASVVNDDIKELERFVKNRKKRIKNYYLKPEYEHIREEIQDSSGLNIFAINKYLFEPLLKPSRYVKRYSELEILIVLEFYQEQMLELNKTNMFPPQLEQYCRLLGISTNIFKKEYLNSSDEEMRNAAQQVIDYIASGLSYAGMTRQVDSTSQVFVQKSSLNRTDRENSDKQEPKTIIAVVSAEEFKDNINSIMKEIGTK